MKKNDFGDRVRKVVRQIPKGSTASYKEVAAAAGYPGAARAVGTVMRLNYDKTVPCHRVIMSNGSLGHYNRGGVEKKRKLLKSEGARF
jgi:O-6-methylguanine DNA methyltransferase